jgi:UDP-glucose 4-epimerase
MSEYLVTGGCGFIGSHLCDALLERGDRVRVLDNLSTGSLANIQREIIMIEGDISDAPTVEKALEGCDGCFHLAAVASVERSNREWVETHRVNLTGTIQVFAAARSAGAGGAPVPVIYASSAAVYGDQGSMAFTEATSPMPSSAYGADKLACEHHGRIATLLHGVPTVGLRFFNVYGPRQDPRSPYSGAISIFCDRIASDKPVAIFGDGRQTRDFIYVADVTRALMLALARLPNRPVVLNVCTGTSTSINELAAILARTVGRTMRLETLPERDGEIRYSRGDPSLAREILGFEAHTLLKQGLGMTLRSF